MQDWRHHDLLLGVRDHLLLQHFLEALLAVSLVVEAHRWDQEGLAGVHRTYW